MFSARNPATQVLHVDEVNKLVRLSTDPGAKLPSAFEQRNESKLFI